MGGWRSRCGVGGHDVGLEATVWDWRPRCGIGGHGVGLEATIGVCTGQVNVNINVHHATLPPQQPVSAPAPKINVNVDEYKGVYTLVTIHHRRHRRRRRRCHDR